MTDSKTVSLITPSGKEFVIRAYLTARDANALRASLLEGVNLDPITGQTQGGVSAQDVLIRGNRKMIESFLISYDGSEDQCVDRLETADHPQSEEDYTFVLSECSKRSNFGLAK